MTLDDLKALDIGFSWANNLEAIQQKRADEARMLAGEQEKRDREARRFAGLQSYQTDVASGLSPLEAIRRNGAKLFAENPENLIRAEQILAPKKTPIQESFTTGTLNGLPVQRSSSGRIYPVPQPVSPKENMPDYEKETLHYPAVDAVPAKEAVPADVTSHWFKNLNPFGPHIPDTTNSPAIPAMPATPAMPPRDVTRRVKTSSEIPQDKILDQPKPASSGAPKEGEVRQGYRFKGGSPANKDNWEKI